AFDVGALFSPTAGETEPGSDQIKDADDGQDDEGIQERSAHFPSKRGWSEESGGIVATGLRPRNVEGPVKRPDFTTKKRRCEFSAACRMSNDRKAKDFFASSSLRGKKLLGFKV